MTFDSIFETRLADRTLTPRQRIRVGGIELGPGVTLARGVAFGGIDFNQFIGHDLEVEADRDILVIKGIYEQG